MLQGMYSIFFRSLDFILSLRLLSIFPKPISKFFNFEKTLPMKRYGNHQELANLAAYMVSDYAGYMNGEVVTLDSGEWIKNAGQFNKLDKIPKKAWGLIERAVRGKKK